MKLPIPGDLSRNANVHDAVSALIAEYNAIRAASLSRETNNNSLKQFETVLLGATIAAIPTILNSGRLWFLLPVVAFLLTAMVASSRTESELISKLLDHEVALRKELKMLLGMEDLRIWEWEKAYRNLKPSKWALIDKGGIPIEPAVTLSTGGLLLFFYRRHWSVATPVERLMFWLASIVVIWGLLAYLRTHAYRIWLHVKPELVIGRTLWLRIRSHMRSSRLK